MTNNERFNAVLNSCQHPRAVYDALLAWAQEGLNATTRERLTAAIMTLTEEECRLLKETFFG